MKADVINKKLHLFCENDLERKKLYKFLKKTDSQYILDVGTLDIKDSELIGLYLEVLNVKKSG